VQGVLNKEVQTSRQLEEQLTIEKSLSLSLKKGQKDKALDDQNEKTMSLESILEETKLQLEDERRGREKERSANSRLLEEQLTIEKSLPLSLQNDQDIRIKSLKEEYEQIIAVQVAEEISTLGKVAEEIRYEQHEQKRALLLANSEDHDAKVQLLKVEYDRQLEEQLTVEKSLSLSLKNDQDIRIKCLEEQYEQEIVLLLANSENHDAKEQLLKVEYDRQLEERLNIEKSVSLSVKNDHYLEISTLKDGYERERNEKEVRDRGLDDQRIDTEKTLNRQIEVTAILENTLEETKQMLEKEARDRRLLEEQLEIEKSLLLTCREQLTIEKSLSLSLQNDQDIIIKSLKEEFEQIIAVQVAEGISSLEREVYICIYIFIYMYIYKYI
jgi:hypothetical protein